MLPVTTFPDFQLVELMRKHRIPERLRPAYAEFIRTGRRTKGLVRAWRKANREPLDDNRYRMCAMAIGSRGLDNITEGIRGWTASGQPLRVVS